MRPRLCPNLRPRENRNPASSLSGFRKRLCPKSRDPEHWQGDPSRPRAQNRSGKDARSQRRRGHRSSRGSEPRATPVGGAFPDARESFPAPHPEGRTPAGLKSSWHRGPEREFKTFSIRPTEEQDGIRCCFLRK